MVVQHNLRAMNSNRMLGLTSSVQSKSTEKLSSGYKINRAADDAAGLSISEKMRKQIRGLSQASLNASDGISAVQTAEGALGEVQEMLQRMNELAVKASNGTMSEDDRSYIQNEISQLETEINRVAETTKFNETYMLKGASGTKVEYMNAHDAGLKGTMVNNGEGKSTFTVDTLVAGDKIDIGGKEYEIINGAEQKIAQDYSYTEASNATAKISLDGWTTGDSIVVNFGTTVTAAYAAGTLDDPSEVLYTLNNNENFSKFATATYDEATKELVITAKSDTMTADELAGKLTTVTVKGDTANGDAKKKMVTGPVKEEYKGDFTAELYAKGGIKALTEEEAKAELAKGNQLYTTAAVDYGQTEAAHKYVDTTGASLTLDLTDWATGGSVIFDGVTVGYTATTLDEVKEVAETINNNVTLKEKYVASYDADKKTVTITSKDTTVSAEELKKLLTKADVATSNSILTDTKKVVANEPVDNFEGDFSKPLYEYAGTEALTEEEAKAALKEGKTLYTTAAKIGENQVVASKAYDLMKAELLKANQIGDTLGTAAIEYEAREGKAANEIEALSDAYTAGQQASVTLDLTNLKNQDDNVVEFKDTANGIEVKIKGGEITGDAAKVADKLNENEAFAKKYVASYDDDTKKLTVAEKAGEEAGTAARGTAMKTLFTTNTALGTSPAGVTAVEGETNSVKAKWDEEALADVELYTEDGINKLTVDELKEALTAGTVLYESAADAPNNVFSITTGSSEVANTLSFNLHVGADADMTNKINVGFEAMTAEYLGVGGLDVSDSTGMGATYAVDAILDAIQKVSTQRSALGAVQNRLEHTIANLDNVVENTTAAESQIRDTDMATEMVKYSNNNILAQAGQAMLAQANQANQGVLSLLG